MTREELIRNLKYTMEKHKNDTVSTFGTNISVMCKDILDYLEKEPKWIPLTTRPMTEEETEHYFEYTDTRIDDTYTILDCELPEDGQEVLVSHGGYVCVDTFCIDDGCYFEGVDIDDVDAWMPLPKPYEPHRRNEDEE